MADAFEMRSTWYNSASMQRVFVHAPGDVGCPLGAPFGPLFVGVWGRLKCHINSARFCLTRIAGYSLLDGVLAVSLKVHRYLHLLDMRIILEVQVNDYVHCVITA